MRYRYIDVAQRYGYSRVSGATACLRYIPPENVHFKWCLRAGAISLSDNSTMQGDGIISFLNNTAEEAGGTKRRKIGRIAQRWFPTQHLHEHLPSSRASLRTVFCN